MTNRGAFDLLTFPLSGKQLIEASAGTGKTFSLAGLYLRLLIEKQLDVRDILVMTFTRAATQELRERIRTRLTGAALLAAHPQRARADDVEHQTALTLIDRATQQEPREQIARRLREAAARMDDATISTIHGFAQRAAQENAFDSGLPFERGIQVDDPPIHLQACTDYWRSQVLGQPAAQARTFLELWPVPERMRDDLKEALERPQLDLWGPTIGALDALTGRARTLWAREHQALGAIIQGAADHRKLLAAGALNKAVNAAGGVDALMAGLAAGLAGTASGFAILPAWIGDLATDEGTAKHFHQAVLDSYRPQDLELTEALAAVAAVGRLAALKAALDSTRTSIAARKRAGRQFSFADMIEALHAAVTHPDRGADLAAALHRTWRYALVDEFQDTDPLQYQILRTIYQGRDDGALIMIGDPKQAIYGFRGGDVFAYLQAVRDADGVYGLTTNFRSTAGVLAGIDALFRGPAAATAEGEFLVPEIRFHDVQPGRSAGDRILLKDGQRLPSVTAWALPEGDLKKEEAERLLLNACVSEICVLLDPAGGATVRTSDGTEAPLRPGHIAVLTHSNREAADVQQALAQRGVAAVCLQRASVFATTQAEDLLYVLRAADRAARPEALRAALATPLLGLRMADLLALAVDDARWQAHVTRFQDLHEIWRGRGVLAMLEPLLQQAAPRLLALEDGERRMTNYLQLAELLAHAQTQTFGFAGLIQWLSAQMAHPQPDAEVDSQQLRLESDDELVRITTVHRAKGLQFPVVFVPFTPLQTARDPKVPWVFHDDAGRAWLDFAQDGASRKALAARESRAESLRLLYVALTRAEDACYFAWGSVNSAQSTPLAWLLHAGAGARPDQIKSGKPPVWLDAASARARLQAFADRAGDAVEVAAPPEALYSGFRIASGAPPTGKARDDLPTRRPDWSVLSFSRLVAGGRHAPPASGSDDELLELPPATERGPAPAQARLVPSIALRGPAFGTALHQLLENLEVAVAWPPHATPAGDAERQLVARHLQNAGLTLGESDARRALLDAVCGMISRTLHTPLPDIGPLAAVPAARRLVEMEFYLKLGGEPIGRMLEVLNRHGYGVSLAPERAAQALGGLMQGFIDLTVEADGRFWVIDYKTNDLGLERTAYQGEAMARAVRYGHYDLQYLIYLVALHRHLAQTLPDYDPAQHLGGAQYLFLRGLDGASADSGVFLDTPPAELVIELDTLFTGTSPVGTLSRARPTP